MPTSIQHLCPPPAAISFFVFFSRFEYALKATGTGGYLKKKRRAKPNWEKLAKELGSSFWNEVRDSGKAAEILKRPPREQIVKNDNLDWEDTSIGNAEQLFDAIRLIRNNLFHGGKYPLRVIPDASRDIALLEQAQWILDLALEKRPTFKEVFSQEIE